MWRTAQTPAVAKPQRTQSFERPYTLGIEGGGTRTTALLTDARGREIHRATFGPGNVRLLDDPALARLMRGIAKHFDQPNAIGLGLAAQEGYQLPQLNPVRVPEGVEEAIVRQKLLRDFNIEVGAGLGSLKGKIWRVGLMGEGSTRENVRLFLSALCQALTEVDYQVDGTKALAATA